MTHDHLLFTQLSDEIMAECPANSSHEFQEGYRRYTTAFFEELILHSDIFYDCVDETCTVDLDYLFQDTKEKTALDGNHGEFSHGAELAKTRILQTLVFVFRLIPTHKVA